MIVDPRFWASNCARLQVGIRKNWAKIMETRSMGIYGRLLLVPPALSSRMSNDSSLLDALLLDPAADPAGWLGSSRDEIAPLLREVLGKLQVFLRHGAERGRALLVVAL